MLFSKLRQSISLLKRKILTTFGDIKIYPTPLWFLYDPGSYKLTGKDFDKVSSRIRKFDVLLRRFDRYLDTYFIPGFWNHAGLYLGNPGELNGEILHAVAEGVVSETLFDFMKSDHIIVLRPTFLPNNKQVQSQVLATAAKLKGKEYDFDFDFSSSDRMSCTELIATVFADFQHNIPRDRYYAGRKIIAPDDITKGAFEVVCEIRQDRPQV
jgi:hypothetical protein